MSKDDNKEIKKNISIKNSQRTRRNQISKPAGKNSTEKVSLSIPKLWKKI